MSLQHLRPRSNDFCHRSPLDIHELFLKQSLLCDEDISYGSFTRELKSCPKLLPGRKCHMLIIIVLYKYSYWTERAFRAAYGISVFGPSLECDKGPCHSTHSLIDRIDTIRVTGCNISSARLFGPSRKKMSTDGQESERTQCW